MLAWYDTLAIRAAGRLYWSEEQVHWSDVNFMAAAVYEHQNLLKSIFGGGRPSDREPLPPNLSSGDAPRLTPKVFDAVFGGGGKKSNGK